MFGRRIPRPSANFIAHVLALSSFTLIALIVLGLGQPQAAPHAPCTPCAARSVH